MGGCAEEPAADRPGDADPVRRLAVAPLVDSTAGGSGLPVAVGLPERLIDRLGRRAPLRVLGATTAFQLGAGPHDAIEVHTRTRADGLLTGVVRGAGDSLGVRISLRALPGGRELVALELAAPPDSLPLLERRISAAVLPWTAGALTAGRGARTATGLRATDGGTGTALEGPVPDPGAYRLWLQGRAAWHRRTPAALRRAAELFSASTRMDSGFAAPRAALSDVYATLGAWGAAPRAESLRRSIAEAQAAVVADSSSADAWASLGSGLAAGRAHGPAERSYLRAIAWNPSHATAHHWYANLLFDTGRTERGMLHLEMAATLDPLAVAVQAALARENYLARRYGAAIEAYGQTLELAPALVSARVFLAMAYAESGRAPEAVRLADRTLREATEPLDPYLASLAYVYVRAGRDARGVELLREAIRRESAPAVIAGVHAWLGNRDEALRWLDTAVARGPAAAELLRGWQGLDPIRSDPRFAAAVRRLGEREGRGRPEEETPVRVPGAVGKGAEEL